MADLFQYIGIGYVVVGALLGIVEGAKKIAGLNGEDGPEDRALSAAEKFLHSASDVLGRLGPDLRKKS